MENVSSLTFTFKKYLILTVLFDVSHTGYLIVIVCYVR